MNTQKLTFFVVIGILGAWIGSFGGDSPSAWGAEPVGHIRLDPSVTADQAALLRSDRALFQSLQFDPNHPALRSLLGLSTISSQSLIEWLEARVGTVVGETFTADGRLYIANRNYPFPNPGAFPIIEPAPVAPLTQIRSNPQIRPSAVIMSNLGVSLYQHGKRTSTLLGLRIDDGRGDLHLTSPRVGLIKVGPALFRSNRPVQATNQAAIGNAINRMSTFFHEARHSDGNGRSLGFLHAVCPPDHDLAGNHACDRNLNGPYTIGGWMVRTMTEACTDCTPGEREALRIRYLDSFNRILRTQLDGSPSVALDPTPEGARR